MKLFKRTPFIYKHKNKGDLITRRVAIAFVAVIIPTTIAEYVATRTIGVIPSIQFFNPIYDYFVIPLMLAILAWALFIRPFVNRRILRAARRNNFFTCPMCAYDLSATQNFTACPECGLKGNHETFTKIWTNPVESHTTQKLP